MVLLSAMRPADSRYACHRLSGSPDSNAALAFVVADSPIVEPLGRYHYALGSAGRISLKVIKPTGQKDENAMQEGSPTLILRRGEPAQLPPVLLIQGTNDQNIPLSLTMDFVGRIGKLEGISTA